jgi:hypothetical protein
VPLGPAERKVGVDRLGLACPANAGPEASSLGLVDLGGAGRLGPIKRPRVRRGRRLDRSGRGRGDLGTKPTNGFFRHEGVGFGATWRGGAGRRRLRPVVLIADEPFAETTGLGAVASPSFGAIGSVSLGLLGAVADDPLLGVAGRRREVALLGGGGPSRGTSSVVSRTGLSFPIAVARGRLGVVGQVTAIVLWLDVGDVEEAVAADREVDERGLDGRLEVDDFPFVNVPGVALVAGPLDVKLLQDAVLDDGDSALLGLEHVDQHFFLHAVDLSGAIK